MANIGTSGKYLIPHSSNELMEEKKSNHAAPANKFHFLNKKEYFL